MSRVSETSREALLERRGQLEADLNQLAGALEGERAKSVERQEAIQSLRQGVESASEEAPDSLREEWYLAVYQDAQQAMVVTHSLIERYGVIASLLLECQQQLTQHGRVHRRGVPDSGS